MHFRPIHQKCRGFFSDSNFLFKYLTFSHFFPDIKSPLISGWLSLSPKNEVSSLCTKQGGRGKSPVCHETEFRIFDGTQSKQISLMDDLPLLI